MKQSIAIFGVILVIGIIYLKVSDPAKAEIKLAYETKMNWNGSSIINHSTAYVEEALRSLNEYEHKVDSKLFELQSKQIQAQQSLKSNKFNSKQLRLKTQELVDEYKILIGLNDSENANRVKALRSKILRLDTKSSSILKKIELQNSAVNRTDELIDQTYATKTAINSRISEIDLIAVDMRLNGNSATDQLDIEKVSTLLANVKTLSNHIEYKRLDLVEDTGFTPIDRDQRFLEIISKAAITNTAINIK
jgi:hypothetical protein